MSDERELIAEREKKVEEIRALGANPYANGFTPTHTAAEIHAKFAGAKPAPESAEKGAPPVMLSEELAGPSCPPVRLRVMNEDLIAFRDEKGDVGIHLSEHAFALLLGLTRGLHTAIRTPDYGLREPIRVHQRELYETTYKQGKGFSSDDWWNAVQKAAGGQSFADFYSKYIDGRAGSGELRAQRCHDLEIDQRAAVVEAITAEVALN